MYCCCPLTSLVITIRTDLLRIVSIIPPRGWKLLSTNVSRLLLDLDGESGKLSRKGKGPFQRRLQSALAGGATRLYFRLNDSDPLATVPEKATGIWHLEAGLNQAPFPTPNAITAKLEWQSWQPLSFPPFPSPSTVHMLQAAPGPINNAPFLQAAQVVAPPIPNPGLCLVAGGGAGGGGGVAIVAGVAGLGGPLAIKKKVDKKIAMDKASGKDQVNSDSSATLNDDWAGVTEEEIAAEKAAEAAAKAAAAAQQSSSSGIKESGDGSKEAVDPEPVKMASSAVMLSFRASDFSLWLAAMVTTVLIYRA